MNEPKRESRNSTHQPAARRAPREFAPWEQPPRPAPRPTVQAAPVRPVVAPPIAKTVALTRKPNMVYLFGVAAMFLGFFMPWISVDFGPLQLGISGYKIPGAYNSLVEWLAEMGKMFLRPGDPQYEKIESMKSHGLSLYAIYLVPLLSLAGFIEEMTACRKNRNWAWVRTVVAVSPILAFVVIEMAFLSLGDSSAPNSFGPASKSEVGLFDLLAIGAYLSIAGFLATVVGIFVAPKPAAVSIAPQSLPIPAVPLAPAGEAFANPGPGPVHSSAFGRSF